MKVISIVGSIASLIISIVAIIITYFIFRLQIRAKVIPRLVFKEAVYLSFENIGKTEARNISIKVRSVDEKSINGKALLCKDRMEILSNSSLYLPPDGSVEYDLYLRGQRPQGLNIINIIVSYNSGNSKKKIKDVFSIDLSAYNGVVPGSAYLSTHNGDIVTSIENL